MNFIFLLFKKNQQKLFNCVVIFERPLPHRSPQSNFSPKAEKHVVCLISGRTCVCMSSCFFFRWPLSQIFVNLRKNAMSVKTCLLQRQPSFLGWKNCASLSLSVSRKYMRETFFGDYQKCGRRRDDSLRGKYGTRGPRPTPPENGQSPGALEIDCLDAHNNMLVSSAAAGWFSPDWSV